MYANLERLIRTRLAKIILEEETAVAQNDVASQLENRDDDYPVPFFCNPVNQTQGLNQSPTRYLALLLVRVLTT